MSDYRLVAMAEGNHTFPSRTRPLSPPAPMVLGPQGPGRVGRCQAVITKMKSFLPWESIGNFIEVYQVDAAVLYDVSDADLDVMSRSGAFGAE